MQTVILNHIPYTPDLAQLQQHLHIRSESQGERELSKFVQEAQSIARPKALYKSVQVEKKSLNEVSLNGVTLTSRVLRVNLDPVEVAFPFLVTCGLELEAWSQSIKDFLYRFWADAIKEQALSSAFQAFEQQIIQNNLPGHSSMMNPGSLEDWPLQQQKPLFAILGEEVAGTGVQLSESCLMIPNKTVSGIRFAAEADFESCQLCQRENCPNRRAPYDEHLYALRYQETA